mgnify:CR=1 FL=1
MKNTTLGRKASNDMKKDSGTSHEPRRRDQAGDGADFAFNGQMGDGVNGHGTNGRHAGNQLSHLKMKENYGMGPRHGNASDSGDERDIGPSATKDAHRLTIATASQGHPVGRMSQPGKFANPDAINVGMK